MPTNKIGGGRDGADENRAFRPRREGARAGDGEAPAPRCQPRRGGRAPREGRGRVALLKHEQGAGVPGAAPEDRTKARGARTVPKLRGLSGVEGAIGPMHS